MRKTTPEYFVLANDLYPELTLKSYVFIDGLLQLDFGYVENEDVDELRKQLLSRTLSFYTFRCTDKLEALILWEIDYMASHNYTLRRCENCHRYFIPCSAVNCYCDRPIADRPGKTCKDLSAMTKYQAEVNGVEAKKLYRQTNNRLHQWAKRNERLYPQVFRVNYREWNFRAQDLRDKVISGKLPYEEFESAMTGESPELLGIK